MTYPTNVKRGEIDMVRKKKTDDKALTPQEETAPPAAESETSEGEDRRGFLVKSGALLAALGVTGLTGEVSALAQELNPRQIKALQDTMDEAFRTKDMSKALASQGRALPADVKSVLSRLTTSDLEAAASLNKKLGGLRDTLKGANNNGVIGM
jgi:hypothetical protein